MRALRPRRTPARARPSAAAARADPVTAEIIRGAMETIAYEMATHVSLTATTPILNQSNERNATILDAPRLRWRRSSVGIPQFMLSLDAAGALRARVLRARTGSSTATSWSRNDPYHGGGHLPDYNIFAPVFHDGEMVLIASIQCHHADTGGGVPGGYNVDAPDIWAEGVRFPALKIYEKGVERRDVTYMMAVNNRTPTFLGDLRAQVGAAQLGVAPPAGGAARATARETVRAAVRLHRSTYAKRALPGRGRVAGPTASTSRTSTSTTTRRATRTSTSTAR